MNEEERQRTMDFILQQQAKFDARLDKLIESDAKADVRLTRLESILKRAIRTGLRERREWRERYAALVDAQIRTEDAIGGLTDRMGHAEKIVQRSSESIDRLSASLEQTEKIVQRNSEDINRLVRIMERNATGRNGGDAE